MKRLCLLLFVLFTTLSGFSQSKDWAGFSKYAESNKVVTKSPKAVFMGNSITEGWIRQHPDFFKNNQFISRGISGQTTSQMLVRFRNDVINLNPEYVVILAGTNDIAQNNGYISNENILSNIISMCELAKLHNIKVVLCSVLPAAEYPWRKEIDAITNIRELNNLMEEYATANDITYVNLYAKMKDNRSGLPKEYTVDEVHLSPKGYEVMEDIVLPYIK
ncbi:MAG: GDSL-type esterase/lipase family protein [Bacteroidales bacterium]